MEFLQNIEFSCRFGASLRYSQNFAKMLKLHIHIGLVCTKKVTIRLKEVRTLCGITMDKTLDVVRD